MLNALPLSPKVYSITTLVSVIVALVRQTQRGLLLIASEQTSSAGSAWLVTDVLAPGVGPVLTAPGLPVSARASPPPTSTITNAATAAINGRFSSRMPWVPGGAGGPP